ncbi:hypothetical protein MTR_8g064570 [Medicago truncatula]|uniref:Uncharacterized protein n=1 Tax=Medicago truncatula TaxID=3880 RepID=A0A072TT38_MEDTR|nr:hypothetical protein MTR_8g064570 [Medicago truncatula]
MSSLPCYSFHNLNSKNRPSDVKCLKGASGCWFETPKDLEQFMEQIFDGLSLGAKERDLELIRYENTKIWRQNIFPKVRSLARPVLGLARPCHTPELLLLLLIRF